MHTQPEPTCRIYDHVQLPDDAVLEDFVILGKPCDTLPPNAWQTGIGRGALIRSHSVVYAGTIIGPGFQCGHHVTIREATRIGANVSIGTGCVIEHHVIIEDGVRLHSNVFVPEFSTLRTGCWLGPHVVLTNAKYPRSANVKAELIGPTIMPGAKIGANSTILPGVIIGEDALVGAGSVVLSDVEARTVVVGNPARTINTIDALPYEKEYSSKRDTRAVSNLARCDRTCPVGASPPSTVEPIDTVLGKPQETKGTL